MQLDQLCPIRGRHVAQSRILRGPVQVFIVVKVSYVLTGCPCFDNLELDIFDAGGLSMGGGTFIKVGGQKCTSKNYRKIL